MPWKPDTTPRAVERDCPNCGAPTIFQRAGLPLVVTADAQRYTPAQAAVLVEPNRLAWCLRESPWTGARLVEVHHRRCEFDHVIDHICPREVREHGRRPEGALW